MPDIFASSSPFVIWVVLPSVIFLARTVDMTLSTVRIVFISQGRGLWAAMIGFFEALLWLMIVGQALASLSNPLCTVAYAAGFAAGNLMGLRLEERLALGLRVLRIFVRNGAEALVDELRAGGWGVTVVDGEGREGPVKILFTLLPRRDVPRVIELVSRRQPDAFLTIEDVRQAKQGFLPVPSTQTQAAERLSWAALMRKGK